MNRGAKGQNVFFNVDQCDRFLDLFGQAVSRYGIRVHGFAIMPNHFHLLVESVEGNLGQAMKYVCFQYGFYLNRAQYKPVSYLSLVSAAHRLTDRLEQIEKTLKTRVL
ncbi:MAG: transposase [Myxococcota bacterium]|nr:transposase [Myxococcota bacterium]